MIQEYLGRPAGIRKSEALRDGGFWDVYNFVNSWSVGKIIPALFLLLFLQTSSAFAQSPATHTDHYHQFSHPEFKSEAEYDKAQGISHSTHRNISKNCLPTHQVYGWHPAWSGTAYERYDFALLSTIGYYAYEVDPKTGGYKTIHQWRETGLVQMAHHSGVQVELTAALSGFGTGQLLTNPSACKTLRDSLIALIKFKDADGICIDFEGLAPKHADLFANWADSLHVDLKKWRKTATLTIILPMEPVQGLQTPRLAAVADRLIVKAYGYRDHRSSTAGPTAPLKSSKIWGESSVTSSINNYLTAGIPKNKLLLAVPYYGNDWPVENTNPPAKTKFPGRTVLLREYEAMDSSAFLQWDSASTTGWLVRGTTDHPHQLWIDQVSSLSEKYALAKSMDLAGVGIWALGYDHGSDRYWDLLKGQFADCSAMDADQLTRDAKPTTPGLEGPTSAERNVWNWVWILGGGIIAIAIIWIVKKYM